LRISEKRKRRLTAGRVRELPAGGLRLPGAIRYQEAGVTVTEVELKARLDATAGAQAAVALFGNPEFKTLTTNLTNALAGEDTTTADALLSRYIVLAKEDLDLGTGE